MNLVLNQFPKQSISLKIYRHKVILSFIKIKIKYLPRVKPRALFFHANYTILSRIFNIN